MRLYSKDPQPWQGNILYTRITIQSEISQSFMAEIKTDE